MGTVGWQRAGTRLSRKAPSETDIQAVVDAFYEAAGDESLIDEATRRASDCMNAGRAVLMVRPGRFTIAPSLFVPVRLDDASLDSYQRYYYQLDPWSAAGEASPQPSGTVQLGEELVDAGRLKNSEFYTDYLKPLDIPQLLVSVVERNPETSATFSLMRGHAQSAFDGTDKAAFKALQPAIRTATRTILLIRKLSAQAQARSQALMKIGQAVVLINADGEVIAINDAATRLFQTSVGLRIERRRLTASRPADNREIQRLIDAAKRPGQAHEPVGVSDAIGAVAYALTAIPLRCAERAHFATDDPNVPAVAVIVATPDSLSPADAVTLKQVFGLTAAQAKVAQMLASGKSLVAIAKALGITHETARFHLKHAMQKTGTSHQAELVKKVLGLSANTTGS